MLLYLSPSSEPWFNIAAEEFFLKSQQDDIVWLYRNQPAIIVGKHQNAIAEINVPWVHRNNIPVVRRISGGGTVFHDFGNLNYAFITHEASGNLVDFTKATRPILDFLVTLGVEASLRGKSDLVVDGLKFSGNAGHVFRNRVLHHGTMLFDADLDRLRQALSVHWSCYSDHSIRSNPSKVTNIKPYLRSQHTLDNFLGELMQYLAEFFGKVTFDAFPASDIDKISQLANEKYRTKKWNFGYSPAYHFYREHNLGKIQVKISIKANEGLIHEADIHLFSDGRPVLPGELRLEQVYHDYEAVDNALKPLFPQLAEFGIEHNDLMDCFF